MTKYTLQEYDWIKAKIEEWALKDADAIAELCSELIQCETPSEPGDTRSAAKVIGKFLQNADLPYEVLSQNDAMPNILSFFQGSREGRHFMFNGHMDVMPAGNEPGWSDSPWSGKIEEERIWGRGAQDMKGGLAAMLFAYVYLSRLSDKLAGRVSISIVSDEESGLGRGTGFLFEVRPNEMTADCVLSGEPSGIDAISFSSKGYLHADIFVKTRGAIAGYGCESKNAIDIAADIVRDLKKITEREVDVAKQVRGALFDADNRTVIEERRSAEELSLIDKVTIDVTAIEGGDFAYTIAPSCKMSIVAVIPAGCDPFGIFCAIRKVVEAHPGATIQLVGATAGEWSDPNDPFVAMLQDASEAFGCPRPAVVPDIALSDCRYWRYQGIPAFWYGPDGSLCSAANEHVKTEELVHLVCTYTLAVFDYLQQAHLDNSMTSPAKTKSTDALPISLWMEGSLKPSMREIPSFQAICLEGRAEGFASKQLDPIVEDLIERLLDLLKDSDIFPGTVFAIMVLDEDESGRFVHITVGTPFPQGHTAPPGLIVKTFSSVEAATCVHRGPGGTEKSWSALQRYARDLGRKNSGEYREDYLICDYGPESLWATELILPLEP